ncbi:hypothetical protein [Streptomyces macrosporus]|uniref:Uncharacterized protein n=1 Tax=Streptomyces macrosporus TaxID=44032 RepID=A0ABN3JK62_9ACTN
MSESRTSDQGEKPGRTRLTFSDWLEAGVWLVVIVGFGSWLISG